MTPTTTTTSTFGDPAAMPELLHLRARRGASERLAEVFTAEQIDAAVDRAARASRCTVAVFAAAPAECWEDDGRSGACAEFVIEFFVPPASVELFHRELEAQLLLASRRYVTGRYRGDYLPCSVHAVEAGTCHQYRIATRMAADELREARWSQRRELIDALLHQARTGWREAGMA
jgi:hypothetical protein